MSSKKQTAKYNFMNETMYQLKVLRTLTPSRRQGGRERISSFPFLLATKGEGGRQCKREAVGWRPLFLSLGYAAGCLDLARLVASHTILGKIKGTSWP